MARVNTAARIDLQALASEVAEFGGLKPTQAGGLVWFFTMVERQAFFAAIEMARGSYVTDAEELYRQYRGAESPAEAQSVQPTTD